MAMYDLVLDGAVLKSAEFAEAPADTYATNKGRWLPRLVTGPDHDPTTEVREGPTVTVGDNDVVYAYTVRAKTGAELDALIAGKDAAIEREFDQRWTSHITFAVDGVDYQWHADRDAVTNIAGVLQAYREGPEVGYNPPDPRTWNPVGAGPVVVTRADLTLLGLAIAGRKDALFAIKKAKQAAVAALTNAADIIAYDPADGWE